MKTFIILTVLCIACAGCSSSEPAVENASVSSGGSKPPDQPSAASQKQQIDAAVSGVAREFAARIARNVGGHLQSLTETNGNIAARWRSPKCDWIEGEVTDLLISVHREFKGEVNRIEGVRECNGQTRSYALSGLDFQRYRTGQINDPEVLKGIK